MKKIIISASLLTLLDQIVKFLVIRFLEVGESLTIFPGFFRLTYVKNIGAAWSLFEGGRVFLILITLVSLLAIYFVFLKDKKHRKSEVVLYSFLLGGILGNLLDRIFRGYVVDYFDFTIGNYQYPIFNLADILIVVAAICIILSFIREEKNGNYKNRRK